MGMDFSGFAEQTEFSQCLGSADERSELQQAVCGYGDSRPSGYDEHQRLAFRSRARSTGMEFP